MSRKRAEEKQASVVEKARGAVLVVKAVFPLIGNILHFWEKSVKPCIAEMYAHLRNKPVYA
jgi:hypothetical protein